MGVRPLTGGVASDIAVVALPGREVVVKFALPKLRVAADWEAPVHRNGAEYAWLRFAHATCPDNAPALLGRSERLQGFAMEYLRGDHVYLWKARLLEGHAPAGEAAKVGRLLGRLHAASTEPGIDRSPFENREDFRTLRLEPYLGFTATRHPALAAPLGHLAEALYAADNVVIHGDVSPKNILIRDGTPVLLDAECATLGDPCFDVAFCLNHLILKAFHLPQNRSLLLGEVRNLWESYAPFVAWEAPGALERRVAALLPALMLARIDGKSPVEYLSEATRVRVREVSIPLVAAPPPDLAGLVDSFERKV